MISVSNLSKTYGDRTLFDRVSFQLDAGRRYGLVGANGSGKTTLLNILAGRLDPSQGTVSVARHLRLGVLRQDHFVYDEREILSVALMGNPELWEAMAEKEEMLAAGEEGFDAGRFSELEEVVQLHDGYGAEARAAAILEGLGLPAEVHRRPLSTLSGGFKLRVLLAQVLASAPDALLLDEPTNHLDILSIRWLEKFLRDFAGPVVVISHDHRFLDNVVIDVLDVDYETVTHYRGNYSALLPAKRAERERRQKEIEQREREIAHHRKFVDRFRAKASKARQAQSKLRLIEKKAASLEALPGSSRRYPTFRFEPRRASGREALKVRAVAKSFGEKRVLDGVDLDVRRGDRVAIMGANGIGKSTLLKIIVGDLEPDGGEVEWGYETHPGYFAQDHREQMDGGGLTAEAWLWRFAPGRDRGYVRAQMGLVLLSGDDGAKKVEALSGGEAARLVFSRLALEQPNVLVLDEPTNHLDLESIEALVAGLERFDGTLLMVSHDRWFVSRLATRIVEIGPDGVTDYEGTYEEYVHFCGDDHLDADTVVLRVRKERSRTRRAGRDNGGRDASTRPESAPPPNRRKLERRRDELTERIDAAEARVAEIDEAFCRPGYFEETTPEEVAALERERDALRSELERLMAHWELAEAQIERMG